MTLQVVIHGFPLRFPHGARGRWGWIHRLRGMFARHVLQLDTSRADHRATAPRRVEGAEAEDLGVWVGAIQVRQVPETRAGMASSQSSREEPLFTSVDFRTVQEGRKVKQIFAQNQIRVRPSRPERLPLRSVPAEFRGRRGPSISPHSSQRIAG